MKQIAIFASGTGTNFIAIHNAIKDGFLDCNIAILISDNPNSKAIEHAKNRNINVYSFNPKQYKSKRDFEIEIINVLAPLNINLIVLAGYMRIIGPTLLNNYLDKIINIHPSLLPNFPGRDAVGQALESKAKETGVTVHFVDSGIDTGRVIQQVSTPIYSTDTRETLEQRIHEIEHKLYKLVIKQLLEEPI
jgi:phosphoribosylglycinamide formyltransferase-1